MNLRFTPTVLALVFAIKSAGARRTGEELLVSELADVHSDDSERNNEKSTAHRRAELISTSIFEQGPADGLRFYYPDVGILQGRKSHSRSGFYMNGRGQRSHAVSHSGTDKRLRFLEVEEAPICGTNGTCLPSACECMANLTPLSDRCAPVFNSLCNGYTDVDGKNWTSEGCMSPAYPAGLREYVKHYSCPVVKCLVEGGTYEDCFCQMYHSLCLTYGDERPYQVSLYGMLFLSSCHMFKATTQLYPCRYRMMKGHLIFALRTHAAKVRRTRLEDCHVCLGHSVGGSIARSIRDAVLTAHVAPASVTVWQTRFFCLTVLFHKMTSAMECPMQMESSGPLKDATGTIPVILNFSVTNERGVVRWPSVLSMVEHMDHATVGCIILFVRSLVMHERTM